MAEDPLASLLQAIPAHLQTPQQPQQPQPSPQPNEFDDDELLDLEDELADGAPVIQLQPQAPRKSQPQLDAELFEAARLNHLHRAKLLIANGANVNAAQSTTGAAGYAPLHVAALKVAPAMVALLLSHGLASVGAFTEEVFTSPADGPFTESASDFERRILADGFEALALTPNDGGASAGVARQFSSAQLAEATQHWASSQILGQGSFAAVYRGVMAVPGGGRRHVAIKRFKDRAFDGEGAQGQGEGEGQKRARARAKAWESFEQEALVLHTHRHPNLLRLFGTSALSSGDKPADSACMALVLEHCECGSLFDTLSLCRQRRRSTQGTQALSQAQALGGLWAEPPFALTPLTCVDWLGEQDVGGLRRAAILADIGRALAFLHAGGSSGDGGHGKACVHRDVKSSNVLLTYTAQHGRQGGPPGARVLCAKLADFGTARDLHSGHAHEQGQGGALELGAPATVEVRTRAVIGTHGFMPPEYLQEGKISPKMDSYALGVVILELLTGLPPQLSPQLIRDLDRSGNSSGGSGGGGGGFGAMGGDPAVFLTSYVECEFDETEEARGLFTRHLDPLVRWQQVEGQGQSAASCVWEQLLKVSQRCLRLRRRSRAAVVDIQPELEALCLGGGRAGGSQTPLSCRECGAVVPEEWSRGGKDAKFCGFCGKALDHGGRLSEGSQLSDDGGRRSDQL
eukprot:g792.t1